MFNWLEYDEDNVGPDPEWDTWWDLILFDPFEHYRKLNPPEPCSGRGRCHGCMKWCAWCGDVSKICDGDQGYPGESGCDTHRKYPPPKRQPNPKQLRLPFPQPPVLPSQHVYKDVAYVLAS